MSSITFTPKDNGICGVTLKVNDEDDGSTQIQRTIDVENAVPDITITTPGAETIVSVNRPTALAGTFSDAGILDTHTANWPFYRSGSNEAKDVPATVEESGGHGTARLIKAFSTPSPTPSNSA